jgi:hypothetical protein
MMRNPREDIALAVMAKEVMGAMKNDVGHPGAEKPTWTSRGDTLSTEAKNDSEYVPNVSPM